MPTLKKVKVKAYRSEKMVLLAFDWADGKNRNDFLGFAIKRTPGFRGEAISWLPNRIGFKGPLQTADPKGSDTNPIQKFVWWDAQFEDKDLGKTFTYELAPVVGKKVDATTVKDLDILVSCKTSIKVSLVNTTADGKISTHFNRAVVSSQSFSRKFIVNNKFDQSKFDAALDWLANGFEKVIPGFLDTAAATEGAIYHLSDKKWIIPAFEEYGKSLSLVHDSDKNDKANDDAIEVLGGLSNVQLLPRTKASIMHNKFLVSMKNNKPVSLLMGSANFTTDALTSQANLLHIFNSPELANLYLERKRLLEEDPAKKDTAAVAAWSDTVKVGKATIRVFFSPEKKNETNRLGLGPVEKAILNAKKSVLFCIFTPTDKAIRDACFKVGDANKMMFGIVNSISDEMPESEKKDATFETKVALFHRSKNNRDVYDHAAFAKGNLPAGFWWELSAVPKKVKSQFPVYIHHKFIVIDGETDNPIIYSGSANMSNNSNYNNDENLLEIKNAPDVARIYLAEFFRLYEHYRARARFAENQKKTEEGKKPTFKLTTDRKWANDDYTPNTSGFKMRVNMSS